VETASGPGPILVVDGDARPVGWADVERPGQVFQLGATFSPETDSLRGALDSALTSPFGLAVAVTADTGRYAGVVSADAILDKVRDVRTSVAESISIRDAEAAFEYEPAAESDAEYDDIGETDYAAETSGESEQSGQATESEQPEQAKSVQPEPAEAYAPPLDEAALSEAETREVEEAEEAEEAEEVSVEDAQAAAAQAPEAQPDQPADDTVRDDTVSDDTINIEQAESSSDESAADQPPSEGHPTDDGHRESQEANGEARYRRGSGVAR
jgi:osmoprotectant transport system ATP-binding protein